MAAETRASTDHLGLVILTHSPTAKGTGLFSMILGGTNPPDFKQSCSLKVLSPPGQ